MHHTRPYPRPPLFATAWGTAPAPLDPRGYFNSEHEVFAWCEFNQSLHTVFIERTSAAYPYRVGGRVFVKHDGGWTPCPRARPEVVFDVVMKSMFEAERHD